MSKVLQMALEVGAIKVGRVALDGTKIKANASKHKAMSYGRMGEKQSMVERCHGDHPGATGCAGDHLGGGGSAAWVDREVWRAGGAVHGLEECLRAGSHRRRNCCGAKCR